MAIWTAAGGLEPRFGAEGGELWARGSGSNTLQAAPRSASKAERRQFAQWANGGAWAAQWQSLSEEQKEEWADYAAGRPLAGFFGRPRVRTAQEAFTLYQQTRTTIAGQAPSPPYAPPGETAYSTERQPFEEYLDPLEGFAIVTRVANDTPRDYFFVSARPLPGKAKLVRARTRPVGMFTLEAGPAGRRWTEPSAAAIALDGAAAWTATNELWLMAWEVSQGWPRAVLDPCWTPPPDPPPPPDPCYASLPGTVSVYSGGGVPSGAFGFIAPVTCNKQSVGGLTKYIGSGTGVVTYTDAPGFYGNVSIVIERVGASPDSAWQISQTQNTPFDGQCGGAGMIGTAEDCAPPYGSSIYLEGPTFNAYNNIS